MSTCPSECSEDSDDRNRLPVEAPPEEEACEQDCQLATNFCLPWVDQCNYSHEFIYSKQYYAAGMKTGPCCTQCIENDPLNECADPTCIQTSPSVMALLNPKRYDECMRRRMQNILDNNGVFDEKRDCMEMGGDPLKLNDCEGEYNFNYSPNSPSKGNNNMDYQNYNCQYSVEAQCEAMGENPFMCQEQNESAPCQQQNSTTRCPDNMLPPSNAPCSQQSQYEVVNLSEPPANDAEKNLFFSKKTKPLGAIPSDILPLDGLDFPRSLDNPIIASANVCFCKKCGGSIDSSSDCKENPSFSKPQNCKNDANNYTQCYFMHQSLNDKSKAVPSCPHSAAANSNSVSTSTSTTKTNLKTPNDNGEKSCPPLVNTQFSMSKFLDKQKPVQEAQEPEEEEGGRTIDLHPRNKYKNKIKNIIKLFSLDKKEKALQQKGYFPSTQGPKSGVQNGQNGRTPPSPPQFVALLKKDSLNSKPNTNFELSENRNEHYKYKAAELEIKCNPNRINDKLLILRFPDPEIDKKKLKQLMPFVDNVEFHNCNVQPRYCLVELQRAVNVREAINQISKIPFGNGFLRAEPSRLTAGSDIVPSDFVSIDPLTLYVGNLPMNIKVAEIKQMFPKAERVDIGYGVRVKRTRYAFVRFKTFEDSSTSFESIVNTQFRSKSLIVRFKRNKSSTTKSKKLPYKPAAIQQKVIPSKNLKPSSNLLVAAEQQEKRPESPATVATDGGDHCIDLNLPNVLAEKISPEKSKKIPFKLTRIKKRKPLDLKEFKRNMSPTKEQSSVVIPAKKPRIKEEPVDEDADTSDPENNLLGLRYEKDESAIKSETNIEENVEENDRNDKTPQSDENQRVEEEVESRQISEENETRRVDEENEETENRRAEDEDESRRTDDDDEDEDDDETMDYNNSSDNFNDNPSGNSERLLGGPHGNIYAFEETCEYEGAYETCTDGYGMPVQRLVYSPVKIETNELRCDNFKDLPSFVEPFATNMMGSHGINVNMRSGPTNMMPPSATFNHNPYIQGLYSQSRRYKQATQVPSQYDYVYDQLESDSDTEDITSFFN